MKKEKELLKTFAIVSLHKLFCDLFHEKFQIDFGKNFEFTAEYYVMDMKIIQILISEIIETGEYTLEGIATYTRIPLDIIYDAAYGIITQLSITSWTRIVNLYMQVKPDISKIFFEKIAETRDQHHHGFSLLFSDT